MTPRTLELLELADELQDAGRMGQAKSLARVAQVLRAMSGAERRALAAEVARQVAPELLPEIEAASDLSYDDIAGLVRRVRTLDGDQLREVAHALRDLEIPEIGPEPADARDQDETRGITTISDAPDADLDEAEWDEGPEAEWDEPADTEWSEDASVPIETWSEPAPAQVDDGTRGITTTSDAPGEVAQAAPVETAESEIGPEPAPAQVDDGTRGITAISQLGEVPDGWRRRRLAMDLLRLGEVASPEARDIVALFERTSDRVWVAGAMVDLGLVTVSELTGLLPSSARTRLARRQAA